MRRLLLLLGCAGCAGPADAPLTVGADQTAVLVAFGIHPVASVMGPESTKPRILDDADDVRAYIFAGDRATLRLPLEPLVTFEPDPACAVDELPSDQLGVSQLCAIDGVFTPCTEPHMLGPPIFGQEPYLGLPCFSWTIDVASLQFNLGTENPAPHGAPVVVSNGADRVLLGQISPSTTIAGAFDTRLQVLDVSQPGSSTVSITPRPDRRPGYWGAGATRDLNSVWLASRQGRVDIVPVDGSTTGVANVVRGGNVGLIVDLVTAPDNPEDLMALTSRCALLRRDGDQWKVLSPAYPETGTNGFGFFDPGAPCNGQIEWSRPEEALAVGVALGAPPQDEAAFARSLRQLVRIRGDAITTEPLPFPEDRPEGYLTAVGAYVVDGVRVEVVTALAFAELAHGTIDVQSAKLWFIHDPRLGSDWRFIKDPDESYATPILRLMPWRDGVVATGGYEQAFSDEHWRGATEAALSTRLGRKFGDLRSFGRIASDGDGGYVIASDFPDTFVVPMNTSYRFVWRQRRTAR